mgnify:CR=1 FL=1
MFSQTACYRNRVFPVGAAVLVAAIFGMPGVVLGWCVDTPASGGLSGVCDASGTACDDHPTHESISIRAAQNGGSPNGGKEYTLIQRYSAVPDCEDNDFAYQHQLKHTSIAGSTATWTSVNIASAITSGGWECSKRVWGKCVW